MILQGASFGFRRSWLRGLLHRFARGAAGIISGEPLAGQTSSDNSVPEMATAREHHGHAVLVAGRDSLVVTLRAAGLDDRSDSGGSGDVRPIAKWKESVGSQHGSAGPPPAFSTAIRTESRRLIWPAPTPSSCPARAMTIAFDLTMLQTRQAKARSCSLAHGRGSLRG